MSKISVIIPIYNAEQYLERCLDSIVNQTYGDLEIVLVDDGSLDKSSIICDRYAENDNRIVVIHKKNEGVSAARNDGLDRATGEYVAFVDSDDWIDKRYFEILLHFAHETGSDAVTANIQYVKNEVEDECYDVEKIEHTEYTKQTITEDIRNFIYNPKYQNVITCGLYGMYKKSCFDATRFDTKIHFGEDIEMISKLAYTTEKISHLNIAMYYYFLSPQSAMRSDWSIKKATFLMCLWNINTYLRSKCNKEYEKFEYEYIECFFGFLINDIKGNKQWLKGYKKYEKDFRKVFWRLIKNKYLSFEERIMMLLYYFGFGLYRKFYGKNQMKMKGKIDGFLA